MPCQGRSILRRSRRGQVSFVIFIALPVLELWVFDLIFRRWLPVRIVFAVTRAE